MGVGEIEKCSGKGEREPSRIRKNPVQPWVTFFFSFFIETLSITGQIAATVYEREICGGETARQELKVGRTRKVYF